MHKLRAETAVGAMGLLADGAAAGDMSAFGLSQEDVGVFTGPRVWLASDRARVERVYNVLVWGVLDMIGATRLMVSAEYQSAVISVFVHPVNKMVACSWFHNVIRNDDESEGAEHGVAPVSREQLFACVLELESANPTAYLQRFAARTGMELDV